jgi:hypothetical protein
MSAASDKPNELVRSESEAITSELWGLAARETSETEEWKALYWQAHPVTLRHINRLVTGDETEDWLTFTKRRFFPECVERGLSLGWGLEPSSGMQSISSFAGVRCG